MSAVRRAIIIAAGRGRRLGGHTEELPKCLVEVGGQPILGWVWKALRLAGIDDVVMIRGYRGDVLEAGARQLGMPVRFVDNPEWANNNVLLSLACARHEIDRPTAILYSDIVFSPAVAKACIESAAEVGLVVDRDFRRVYVGRDQHPLEEAEVCDLDARGHIARVGKRALPVGEAVGEFIGLAKLGDAGAAWVRTRLHELLDDFAGRYHEPYQRAARFQNAYLTDLLTDLIAQGRSLDPVFIDGDWREIDTDQDLNKAQDLLGSLPASWQ